MMMMLILCNFEVGLRARILSGRGGCWQRVHQGVGSWILKVSKGEGDLLNEHDARTSGKS